MRKRQEEDAELEAIVKRELAGADATTVRIVSAVAGLLAATAYADREVTPAEEKKLRDELGRIVGMTAAGVNVICEVLERHLIALSTTLIPRLTRTLRELAHEELRMEVLEVLVDMAAADGKITLDEMTRLRNVAQAMGLSQDHYNAFQEKHRDKLSFL